MTSPRQVKTKDTVYSRDSHSPTEWPSTPTKTKYHSVPRIAIPQAYLPMFSEVPVSKIARDARKLEEAQKHEHCEPFVHSFNSRLDSASSQTAHSPDATHSPSPANDPRDLPSSSSESPAPKIARPPNAFMIFRSWWLKQNEIPKHVEKRQQALSRVAGQVWGLLEEPEKQKWHRKAAEIQRKHKEENPDYKFVPSPRGSRRNKDKAQTMAGNATTEEDKTKLLRETYTKYTGPSPIPTRKKQAKKARSANSSSPTTSTHFSLPNSPLPRSTPVRSSPPPATSSSQVQDSSSLVQTQQLHIPRPASASVGFNDYSNAQFSAAEASADANKATEGIHYSFGNTDQSMIFGNTVPNDAYTSAGLDAASWAHQPFAGSSPHLEAKLQGLHQQLAGPFPPPAVTTSQNGNDASQVKELFSFAALDAANFNLNIEDNDGFLNVINNMFHLDAYTGQPDETSALQLSGAQDSQNFLPGSSMGTDYTFLLNQYNFDDTFQLPSL